MRAYLHRALGLVLLAGLALLLLNSCASERQRALNKAQRKAAQVAAILDQYPDLADSLTITTRDTLRVAGRAGRAAWVLPKDTTSFNATLEAYAHYHAQLAEVQVRAAAAAKPGAPVPNALALAAAQKRAQDLEAALATLRKNLQRGAYKSQNYSYADKDLQAEIFINGDSLRLNYRIAPQNYAYTKHETKLRPAAALPEQCQPKRFWQDWLFYVCLGAYLGIRLFGKAAWGYVRALLPQP